MATADRIIIARYYGMEGLMDTSAAESAALHNAGRQAGLGTYDEENAGLEGSSSGRGAEEDGRFRGY